MSSGPGAGRSGPHPPAPSPKAPHPHPATPGEGETRWSVPPLLRERIKGAAREQRREPTASEEALWAVLRGRKLEGLKFRRQQPVGPFVVDFYCARRRLVVEVDGPIHAHQILRDAARQQALESLGLHVLRLPADLVERDLPAALARIKAAVLAPPLPGSGRAGAGFWERGPGGEGAAAATSPVAPPTPEPIP